MANHNFTQVDEAELNDCLNDISAVADTLELLAPLMNEQSGNERQMRLATSALHVLADYLDIRSSYLRNILPTAER